MKRFLIVLFLFEATPVFAQAPTDDEIAKAWGICSPNEIVSDQWRKGFESCATIKKSYEKSSQAIEARVAADKAAADKATLDGLVRRIK